MGKVAAAFNYVSNTQKKVVMVKALDHLNPDPGATSSSLDIWPHCFRTGEATTAVVARVGLIVPTTSTVASIAYNVYVFQNGNTLDDLAGTTSHSVHGTLTLGAVTPVNV